ncbi:hypothetical protein RO3G_08065 [Rhizopus delemar RA 99-880]|uniref:Uncharacterized protein n=1 Tax=Rhizopus delemar (strain RA 99-880 / ATCC MYA-4621 / FGSC 9543 / NRRL 43880) TaxID=246409 RepID=I1C4I0_RHIO9|nr:hypothetical protein RO3G_08065 [Rhizopus delemar RA 99-880]|eukprot:EIE83360.1 hypothetical protein RO3G_08065 [Rhizopus delemar RA 99-880]
MNSTTGENSFNNGAAPNGDNMSMATGSIDLSSFAGSSPLTNDGTAMVLDSFLTPSSSTGEREELLLRQNLTQLHSEFNEIKLFRDRSEFKINFSIELEQYKYCIWLVLLAGDEATADQALQQMDRTKRRLIDTQENLPKFQLALSVVRPFPNEEVFESVEHFLARFENIIKGSAYRDVDDNAWVETDLRKCNTWAEARAAFKEHHDSSLATRHYTDLVFTMQIVINEDKKK